MREEKKRGLLQFHLSTLIILTLMGTVFVKLNTISIYATGEQFAYGWPLVWLMVGPEQKYHYPGLGFPDWFNLTFNLFSFLALMGFAGFTIEFIYFRRGSQHESKT